MGKITVSGITYKIVPELNPDYGCLGCVADNNPTLCRELIKTCGNDIYVDDILSESKSESNRYRIAQEVNQEYINCKEHYAQNTFEYYCLYMQKQQDSEYKEYLRLKEKFKE